MSPSEFAEVSKEELSPSSRRPMPVKPPLPKKCCYSDRRSDRRYGKGRSSSQRQIDWMKWKSSVGSRPPTSVMQFPYRDSLGQPAVPRGTSSRDTYRTLTAVDCCLMVIDAAKGVEDHPQS